MPNTLMRFATAVLVFLVVLPASAPVGASQPASVAVAASLRPAMPAIVSAFERETGQQVRVSYASSGKLTRQILRGAPFELFLAANADYPARLVEQGRTDTEPVTYAIGRIGLFVPSGSPLALDGRLDDLRMELQAGTVERFAIANPRHAPYGVRARQALAHAELWQAIQPVLVLGENAAQTAQFGAAGSVAGAIIPASLAATPRLRAAGRFAAIPGDWYEPLEQRMVLIEGAGDTARRLHRFLRGEQARRILRDHGFAVPPSGR